LMATNTMNMTALAANIARSVGREFPAPAEEMALRQFMSLVEEGSELDQALLDGTARELRGEFADALITVYLLNHYLPLLDLDAELAAWTDGATPEMVFADKAPSYYITQLAQPLRRALGHARRPGDWSAVGVAMVRVVLAIRSHAEQAGIDLASAVSDKADVIFTRGWRVFAAADCDVCGKPIIGTGWRHHRLGVIVHEGDACQSNVRGEDIRGHAMTMVQCGAGAG
jgi:NTP pyrophosphatase (non-canonical NTP hydrolase)